MATFLRRFFVPFFLLLIAYCCPAQDLLRNMSRIGAKSGKVSSTTVAPRRRPMVAGVVPPAAIAPTVTQFEPTSAFTGQIVTITGTDFDSASMVVFGIVPAVSVTVKSATSITAVVGDAGQESSQGGRHGKKPVADV